MVKHLDGISPIVSQESFDLKALYETKKLIKGVKREDAYRIVSALKRGADPCLLVDDISALHMAAGIKSDQRRSMVRKLIESFY